MNTYGQLILMLKKAMTDIVALKKHVPRKYDYGLKLESATLKWLGYLGMISFPLAQLHIDDFSISSLAYYIGILLEIPTIYNDVLSILTHRWQENIKIESIGVALDVIDRLLMIENYKDKAEASLDDAYKYLLKDFFSEHAYTLSALNMLTMAKVSDRIDIHPDIKSHVIDTIRQYHLASPDDIKYLIRLKADGSIPDMLWKH